MLACSYGLISLTALAWLLLIATRLRPIMDDYIHLGRVIEMGVLGSTTNWFTTLLPGFAGVLVISLFSALAIQLPVSLFYVPYVLFLIITLFVLGVVLMRALFTMSPRWQLLAFALTIPPLWFLSVANVFPQYDVINALAMMNWISSGYRVHLPIMFVIAYLIFSMWQPPGRTAPVVAFAAGLVFGWSFLNLLPDLAAYVAISLVGGVTLWRRARHDSGNEAAKPVSAMSLLALGGGLVIGGIGLAISPGTAARAERHPLQFSWDGIAGALMFEVWNFLREMMNVSNLPVLIAAISMGLIAAHAMTNSTRQSAIHRLRFWLASLLLLLVLLIGSGAFGETLTYAAIFHRWPVLQVQFITIIVTGLLLGLYLYPRIRTQMWRTGAAIGVVALAAVFIPLQSLSDLAEDRRQMWDSGAPAPLTYLQDREQDTLRDWWHVVVEYRQPTE